MSDLLHRIIIGATVERVYQSIAFPEGIKHWWTQDVTDGGGIGELLELGFNGRKAVLRFSIDEMVTDQRIKWTCIGHAGGMEEWPGTTLIWMLSPWKSGGTDLRCSTNKT
ncbi:MAG TPA: SRPBCC domain-containing protein [Tepidisphaeraceae bacterium]|nr:SRPBCC domain-containing protein [Tepidisphaeraceae bacterium]